MKRSQVLSTLPGFQEVGDEVLRKGGSALKAVLTGFFVAAGERPGVLWGPVSLLIGGVGSGVRVYDGRVRQPGLGAKRPRGFLPEDTVPAAARVAVPGSLTALALASVYDPGTSLLSCVRPGVQAAERVGSSGRAELLELVASHGAATLSQPQLRRSWLGQFGPAEGGNLAAQDLVPQAELDGPARSSEDGLRFELPWESDLGPGAGAGEGHASVAVDAQGQLVALSFRELNAQLLLEPFDAAVPLHAEPVLRGITCLAAGSVLPSICALEIERDASGALVQVAAFPGGRARGNALRLGRDPRTKAVAALS